MNSFKKNRNLSILFEHKKLILEKYNLLQTHQNIICLVKIKSLSVILNFTLIKDIVGIYHNFDELLFIIVYLNINVLENITNIKNQNHFSICMQ